MRIWIGNEGWVYDDGAFMIQTGLCRARAREIFYIPWKTILKGLKAKWEKPRTRVPEKVGAIEREKRTDKLTTVDTGIAPRSEN